AETEAAARDAGMAAVSSASVAEALAAIAAEDTAARVLICGSLYLAGTVLRENG
ncbi:MAG: bifunctional folylpolyglutamate synthase/dihydrofolate synthase, partial [Cereibacter changlensis]